MDEKSLPFVIDSEQIVLGTLIALCDVDLLLEVIDVLKPEDFYRNAHRTIYAAICLFYRRQNEVPDLIALADLLERKKKLDNVGGASYLTELIGMAIGPSVYRYHVARVHDTAVFRSLAAVASEIASMAYGEQERALERSEQLLYQISQGRALVDLVSGNQVMSDYMTRLDERNKRANAGKPVGIATDFTDLDKLLGGLQPQEFYVLGGRPGQGKTSFLLNIVLNLIERSSASIAIYSMEMSRNDLANRLVSMKSGIDSQFLRTRTLTDYEWDSVVCAADALSNERWFVDESGKLSIASLFHKCRRHKAQHGLDLVIVDYLQMMEGEETVGKRQYNRVQEVGEVSRGLKQLAKDLDVPVLAAASLSRASENRANKRPQLSDLRESGSIESDADVVMFISRMLGENAGHSVIEIAKHRNGPIGEVTLRFDASRTLFRDEDEPLQPTVSQEDNDEWDEN
jgi:replicative DNA helicase